MKQCDLIISDGDIVSMDSSFRILESHDLAISGGKIIDIYPTGSKKYRAKEDWDASGCFVTPGMINAHSHLPMTYLRGVADDMPLYKWLSEYIWSLEAKLLAPDFVYDASLHGAAEMLLNGITLTNDMYFHIDKIADACTEAGMRVIVSEAIIEAQLKDGLGHFIKRQEAIAERYKAEELVDIALAPHAIYTCSRDLLKECAAITAKKGWMIHTHLSETRQEVENCLKEHGKTPYQYLHELGFGELHCLFAHGVHLSESELELMASTRSAVAICTDSNLKLASGFAPLKALRQHGILSPLGTDGVSSNNDLDLLAELSTTAKLHKAINEDPEFLSAQEAFALVTIDAARALGKGDTLGSLEIGKAADLLLIDPYELNSQPLYNIYSHLVYAMNSRQIRDVFVAGKAVVQDKSLVNIYDDELMKKAFHYEGMVERFL
ncbi:MAG: amidohydrolase family protein [Candidatus Cloacimonetes bacterium]|nr:amidohydrolase family protein [Candidatus Cloacimonadota bacterium]